MCTCLYLYNCDNTSQFLNSIPLAIRANGPIAFLKAGPVSNYLWFYFNTSRTPCTLHFCDHSPFREQSVFGFLLTKCMILHFPPLNIHPVAQSTHILLQSPNILNIPLNIKKHSFLIVAPCTVKLFQDIWNWMLFASNRLIRCFQCGIVFYSMAIN